MHIKAQLQILSPAYLLPPFRLIFKNQKCRILRFNSEITLPQWDIELLASDAAMGKSDVANLPRNLSDRQLYLLDSSR